MHKLISLVANTGYFIREKDKKNTIDETTNRSMEPLLKR